VHVLQIALCILLLTVARVAPGAPQKSVVQNSFSDQVQTGRELIQLQRELLSLEQQRLEMERQQFQSERNSSSSENAWWRPWINAGPILAALVAAAFGAYQLRQTQVAQAKLKAVELALEGHDQAAIAERASLVRRLLNLSPSFTAELESSLEAGKLRRHLPPHVVEHRSAHLAMMLEHPESRQTAIRFWNALFNDGQHQWFQNLEKAVEAEEAGQSSTSQMPVGTEM
jgi:hypothetical protein